MNIFFKKLLHSKIWTDMLLWGIVTCLILRLVIRFTLNYSNSYNLILFLFKLYQGIIFVAGLGLVMFLFQLFNKNPQHQYEVGGDLDKWYIERLNNIGDKWCFPFAEKVISINDFYRKINNRLIFVSPSANYGTYEKRFYEAFVQHIKEVMVFCSDLANLPSYEAPIGEKNCQYLHLGGGINALDCFKSINIKANIIFDMKGALWHLPKKEKLKLIQHYSENLEAGGLLIFDDTDVRWYEYLISFYSYHILKYFKINKICRRENSTNSRLKTVRRAIEDNFNLIDRFSFVTKNGRNICFLIYQKKL